MITNTKAFLTSDNKTHATLEDAQRHELDTLWDENEKAQPTQTVAVWLLANKDKIVDILTTTAASKPRARKVNGGTKKRKGGQTQPAAVLADQKQ